MYSIAIIYIYLCQGHVEMVSEQFPVRGHGHGDVTTRLKLYVRKNVGDSEVSFRSYQIAARKKKKRTGNV